MFRPTGRFIALRRELALGSAGARCYSRDPVHERPTVSSHEITMRLNDVTATAAPIIFVLLWSSGFIGAKYGLPYIEPFTFLGVRMVFVVLILAVIALVARARWPRGAEIGHSMVAGSLVHGLYLGGVFIAISQGVPAGISALIPGLQPLLTSTIANRWLGERVTRPQWLGLALGLIGVLMVLHDRSVSGTGSWIGWIASLVSLLAITFGTLYQKRYCGRIDWRTGNLVQYVAAGALFWSAPSPSRRASSIGAANSSSP